MKYVFVVSAIAWLAATAAAQVPGGIKGELTSSYRAFSGSPEGSYGDFDLRVDHPCGTSIYFAGSTGRVDQAAIGTKTVHFGGRDLEIGVVQRQIVKRLDAGIGISFPTTFVDSNRELTYRAKYGFDKGLSVGVRGYFGPTAAHAVEVGKDTPLDDKWSLHLEAAALYSGHSTISANSGDSIRTLLYDGEFRYSLGQVVLSLGISNRLGDTTRFSLASPVGNHCGLVAGCGVKF